VKRTTVLAAAFLVFLMCPGCPGERSPLAAEPRAQAAPSAFTGVWLTQDGDAKVLISEQEGEYSGKIVWLRTPKEDWGKATTDEKNPNPSLRGRPVLGLVILEGFVLRSGALAGGTLYDPTDGTTHACKMWLENDATLKVRGYLGLLFETETWTRSTEQ